ncbi:MAG: acetamidase, partial [Firmicutes bacterium]|nr:acetamidase [Bacillota bacterium]
MEAKVVTKYTYTFSPDNEPAARFKRGEVFKLKAIDGFNNQVVSQEQLVTEIDFSRLNPGTGPVYIEGAEPGDVLA